MKNITLPLSFFFSLSLYTVANAQSDNKLKIIGCWEVRQVIFSEPFEGSDDISIDALGTIVCFDKEGKFTNSKSEDDVRTGTYSLSENGRTIYQSAKRDTPTAGNVIAQDIPGQIVMLSDTELQVQADEMTLYFRKKE